MSILSNMMGRRKNDAYDRAIRFFDPGQYEEALELFEQACTSMKPGSITHRICLFYTSKAHVHPGQSALQAQLWEKAAFHFEQA